MYPRAEYEMTEADLGKILDASKPTPVMFTSDGTNIGGSPQENANRAWAELGVRMGFDAMTVRPAPGKGDRFFTAVPSETEEQRAARIARDAEERKLADIARLKSEIEERQRQLAALESPPKVGDQHG